MLPDSVREHRSIASGEREAQSEIDEIARKGLLRERYYTAVDIAENVALSLVPIPLMTEMMATAMPAAISPYSMAVAPDSSRKNRVTVFLTTTPGLGEWVTHLRCAFM
jgi:hypothetical protein